MFGILKGVIHDHDTTIRPIQFLMIAESHQLFRFAPSGYHIVNATFFIAGIALLYSVLCALRQPRVLALSTSILYMLLPNYSTDRFWIISSAATISMCISFLGVYVHLQALYRGKNAFWRWETLAVLCVIVSGFCYEVFLPFFLLTAAALFVAELAADWNRSASLRIIGKAALRQAPIVAAVAMVILVKALSAPRVPHKLDVVSQILYSGRTILKWFVVSYGYHLLLTPYTSWHVIKFNADSTMLVKAGIVGIVILVRLYTLADPLVDPAVTSQAKRSYIGCGLALFVAGFSLFPINPAENGINNRTAIAGSLGVAVSIVGLLAMLTSLAPGVWRKAVFSGAVAFIGTSGALIIDVLANFWIEAYNLEKQILADIRDHIQIMQSGTSFILEGVCPYNGPAPVFESAWDLSAALSILYGHAGIHANVARPGMMVGKHGLTVPTEQGPTLYPFEQLLVYDFSRKESYALTDFQAAQNYFDKVSTNRAGRCPPDVYGNGVDVLSGLSLTRWLSERRRKSQSDAL